MFPSVARPLPHRQRLAGAGFSPTSVLVSMLVCAVIAIGFVASSDAFWHWFILPVVLCGILIGIDAVDWFRGRLEVFDPVGILGLLGLHFFFLAPLLHVHWQHWPANVSAPPDWRDWLARMAVYNAAGLVIYRFARGRIRPSDQRARTKTFWQIDRHRFYLALIGFLALSAALQAWVYVRFGGISGYIAAATDPVNRGALFGGMGWILMVAESFPILAIMLFAVFAHDKPRYQSWLVIILVLLVDLGLRMLFGGLRGSRSTTIWSLVWAVGVIHFWVRAIPKRTILVGLVPLVIFMYLYGFYKGAGTQALDALGGASERAQLVQETGRGIDSTLLDDLGRSDIQAFLLYRLSLPDSDYEYGWGRTYLAGALILVPPAIWPDRPANKTQEGTNLQYGMGSYVPGVRASSRVYGLAGEAMLNFGPLAAPFAFAALGVIAGWVRRVAWHLEPLDGRMLLYPLLVIICVTVLVGDLDNVIFDLVKNGAFPLSLVMVASLKVRAPRQPWGAPVTGASR